MSFVLRTDALPISEDASGTLRVGGSRVFLEMVIRAFQDGATPKTIVQRYPAVSLENVYTVIAYYLRHPQEIEDYLAGRELTTKEIRERIENHQRDTRAIRSRLLSQVTA